MAQDFSLGLIRTYYYKGHVIQCTRMGYLVSDRVDRIRPRVIRFPSLKAAEAYIDKRTYKI